MRFALMAVLALASGAVSAAPFEATTKGRIVVECNGTKVSEHTAETEATAAAINYAVSKAGKSTCTLSFPQKVFVVALPITTTSTVNVSWLPPTTYTDGSALTNLTGYTLSYGTSETTPTQTLQIAAGQLSQALTLTPGTWYVVMRSVAGNAQSAPATASKTL